MPRKSIDWTKMKGRIFWGIAWYYLIGMAEGLAFLLTIAFDMAKMDRYHDLHQKLAYSRQTLPMSCFEGHFIAYGSLFLLWVAYRIYIRYFRGDWTGIS